MASCAQCGAELADGQAVCTQCGALTTPASTPTAGEAGPPPSSALPGGGAAPPPGYQQPPPGYQQPPPGYGAPPPGYGAPPPGYGAPPYGAPGGQPAGQWGAPAGGYATWPNRVLGYLIDFGVIIVLDIIGLGIPFLRFIASLLGLVAAIWFAIQVGQTGQSPGMRVVGLKCVSESTGQPIGAGMGVVRAIAHIVDSIICLIGWLFPLWDSKRQTLADKIMSTVVIDVPKQAYSITPPAGS